MTTSDSIPGKVIIRKPAGADALHLRAGLPAEFRYLEAQCARADWPRMRLHPSATHWLQIHAWFRHKFQDIFNLGGAWRDDTMPEQTYRAQVMPRLQELLNHLHGHHNIESHSYFPAMAAMEPQMKRGFELLDRDHEAIDGLMNAMVQAAIALNKAADAKLDLKAPTSALIAELERGGGLITRHLDDEEEIIVPVFTLRGDPFGH